jgi:hypothetical protein
MHNAAAVTADLHWQQLDLGPSAVLILQFSRLVSFNLFGDTNMVRGRLYIHVTCGVERAGRSTCWVNFAHCTVNVCRCALPTP